MILQTKNRTIRLNSLNRPLSENFLDGIYFDISHQRYEVSFFTPDLEVFSDRNKKGWSYKKTSEGFLMRSPEEWLVDLTDPYKVLHYGDPICNLAYYNYLRNAIDTDHFDNLARSIIKKKGLNDLQYLLLTGPVLESEIRISGSDNRIKDFKRGLYEEVSKTKEFKKYLEQSKIFLKGCRTLNCEKKSIENAPIEVSSFFYLIKSYYESVDSNKVSSFNTSYFPNLFKGVPEYDVYVFIPWGCFRYISSFVNKKNKNKIMFWEIHYDQYQTHSNKCLAKNLNKKRTLILDNSYTGNTLTRAQKLIKKEGGIPSRLALFPKSKLSVSNSEYVLFIDKIIDSSTLNLSNNNWIIDTYKKVLSLEK